VRLRAHAVHRESDLRIDDGACQAYASSLAARRGETGRPFADFCVGMPVDRELALRLYFGCVNYSFIDPASGAQFVCVVRGRALSRSSGFFAALAASSLPFEDTVGMQSATADALAGAADWPSFIQLDDRMRRLRAFAGHLASAGIQHLSAATTPFSDVPTLVEFLSDSGLYEDEFLKRAQVTAFGIALLLGVLDGAAELTCMPETRLVQLLCSRGVLVPDDEMRRRIEAQPLLQPGDPLERALRAGVIVAGERLAAMTGMYEAEIDTLLWNDAQRAMADGTLTTPALRVMTDAY
jgi:hypothetical protein